MKIRLFTLLLCFFTITSAVMATQPVNLNLEDESNVVLVQNDSHKGLFGKVASWVKTKVTKAKVFVAKSMSAIDFKDEKSMLKWWLIGWGTAIVLGVIAPIVFAGIIASTGNAGLASVASIIALVGYLAGLFGTVCLVFWLIAKFA